MTICFHTLIIQVSTQLEDIVNVLTNYLNEHGFDIATTKLKSKKQNEKLHKPIKDISCLLNLIKEFNYNLYLCCC